MRPGMYIGKLGDGQASDDGIYVLLKEVIDNSIDEHAMGHGKSVRVVPGLAVDAAEDAAGDRRPTRAGVVRVNDLHVVAQCKGVEEFSGVGRHAATAEAEWRSVEGDAHLDPQAVVPRTRV